MGVNGFARTASGDDAIKEAVGQSCCCLCNSEFVVAKKPPAYINFRFSGPGGNTSAGSSTYTELALGLDRAIRHNTVYGEAIEGYDEPPFAPTGAYAPEMRAIPDTEAVTKLRNEKYSGVTAMLFTATPDSVETMYFGGPVPEYSSGCCSGWAALPFPSVSLSPHPSMTVPSVKFNRGNFRLKDAVAAGTNALTGGLSDLIISTILGCPPFKWLPQRTQECMSRNLKYSSNQSFYGWPDGDTSKVATKLLFDDAGYFPSPRIGPAIARGVNKVMIVSFSSFVFSILPLFGLPYVRDQAYVGGSGNDIPPAAYPSMAKIFDAGDPVPVDGYPDVMNGPYAPPQIYTAPDIVKPVTHFPQKVMEALCQATKQFKSETGPVQGFLQDGEWKRSGPEIIVLKGLDVVDNRYHGTHGGRTADLLVYVYPAYYAGFMPTQWTAPGATNLGTWNGEAFPGYEGFPSYASSNSYGAPLLPDIANLSADLACWSMVSQAATIAEFAGPYDLADDGA